jgi:hypothetical protein
LDTNGIFDFVSADICFNKEKSDSIVDSGMSIVPLYCANSATYCDDANYKHYRLGIPFTKVMGRNDNNQTENPFGGVVEGSDYDGDIPAVKLGGGVFDGFEQNDSRLSGGICKYY